MKELKIDPELKDLLPPLTDDEYKQLEKNIKENGFDRNFPIMEWHGYIADGHNRYSICKKYNIEPVIGTLAYDSKEEVMEWMLDIQLGRRNLSPIQRIAVAEKYRPIYEKQAQKNIEEGGRKGGLVSTHKPSVNLPNPLTVEKKIDVREKLASVAGVSGKTYSMGKKILDSDNEILLHLLESNIRRRGEVGGTAKKIGLRIKELERLYGVYQGGHGSNQYMQNTNNSDSTKTQKSLLKNLE